MAIIVLAPGILTSVQDGGRYGYEQYGVSPSGPMDRRSFQTANILAGNDPDEAGLEMTVMGPELKFTSGAVIALAGADMQASLNGLRLPLCRAVSVRPGDILKMGIAAAGCRTYLALHGGIDVKAVMGSRATMIGKKFGGYEGRRLQKGDVLEVRSQDEALPHQETFFCEPETISSGTRTLRVILGPQENRFTEEGIRTFLQSEYVVGQDFDRQGYRLEGPKIAHKTDSNIISDGVVTGSVQVPGTGLPIIMTAERATVGGYTKIATVITADMPLIGQCKAGDRIRFCEVTVEQAQDILEQEEERLKELKKQVQDPSHLPVSETDSERLPAAETDLSHLPASETAPLPDETAHEYAYTKDLTICVNGKSYAVTVRQWK